MIKKVMQQLDLRTTRPYQNVCAMDSRSVKIEGMIERQHIRLAKYPDIHVTMDILVIDVSDKWGMLLSRNFGATLRGSIQMDWTYTTIPASEDSLVKLHTEKERIYHVENLERLSNECINNASELGIY